MDDKDKKFTSIADMLEYVVVECYAWIATLELKGKLDG